MNYTGSNKLFLIFKNSNSENSENRANKVGKERTKEKQESNLGVIYLNRLVWFLIALIKMKAFPQILYFHILDKTIQKFFH